MRLSSYVGLEPPFLRWEFDALTIGPSPPDVYHEYREDLQIMNYLEFEFSRTHRVAHNDVVRLVFAHNNQLVIQVYNSTHVSSCHSHLTIFSSLSLGQHVGPDFFSISHHFVLGSERCCLSDFCSQTYMYNRPLGRIYSGVRGEIGSTKVHI